jgi:phosphoribosylamine--glycine ligase
MQGLVRLAKDENADLAVVGPERPLVAGLVNLLELAGIPASGPTLAAAKLEGSKTFMKQMCELTETPTAV